MSKVKEKKEAGKNPTPTSKNKISQALKEIISESQDCKDIVELVIARLEKEIETLSDEIKRRLKLLHNKDHDEFEVWFWEEYIRVFFVEDLEKKEKSLKYFKSLLSNSPIKQGITDDDIEQARQTPMESVMTIRLYNAGSNRKRGLCPFHQEKTASFVVYPDGYKCFGCGESGNAIDYLMKSNNLNFIEAVKQLVNK